VATLFGLTPPDPRTARVLEIGCSDGGNLLPLALTTPNSRFLGIDLTGSAIAKGRERIRALGLQNIELRQLDLTQFPASEGTFDYIIVHGVYSWVPPEVRRHILRIAQQHLSPNGIAYIDYNAQPGGKLRYAFRESMRYHVQRFPTTQQRVDQARSLINLIIEANPEPGIYRSLAEAELKRLKRSSDAAVFHDSLSAVNDSLFFHEVAFAAGEHQLQFLAEADVFEMSDAHLPGAVRERLAKLRRIVEKEQYLDILKNRVFRQTLLCREGLTIQRALDGSTLKPLLFSSRATSTVEEDGTIFRTEHGSVKTANPLVLGFLQALIDATPDRVSLEQLASDALPADQLAPLLLHGLMSGVVEIHTLPAPFTTTVDERPHASALARIQAEEREMISTLDHRCFTLADDAVRAVLLAADGTRSVGEMLRCGMEEAGSRAFADLARALFCSGVELFRSGREERSRSRESARGA
jgi:ubiquinone/menaquinone biosynthesis C-methylase UbiE